MRLIGLPKLLFISREITAALKRVSLSLYTATLWRPNAPTASTTHISLAPATSRVYISISLIFHPRITTSSDWSRRESTKVREWLYWPSRHRPFSVNEKEYWIFAKKVYTTVVEIVAPASIIHHRDAPRSLLWRGYRILRVVCPKRESVHLLPQFYTRRETLTLVHFQIVSILCQICRPLISDTSLGTSVQVYRWYYPKIGDAHLIHRSGPIRSNSGPFRLWWYQSSLRRLSCRDGR